jgi:hypothetical protein
MIDTIVITLSKSQFHITHPDKFTPAAHWALDPQIKNTLIVSKQNPTKKELLFGIYKPKLTLAYRSSVLTGIHLQLRIELSLPKLIFGNNFNELQYKDFKGIITKLHKALKEMGIETTQEALAQAPVLAIHYSKNIKLTDGSTPYLYIQKLKEASMRLSIDVNQTDYRNEGHAYKWHTDAYEIVFYDKIRDLEKAKAQPKRALEKDNSLQLHLLQKFQKRHMLEILRMEVRLNRRETMRKLFKKLGIKTDLTFKKLFKPAISKKVLLYYLEELESKRPLLIDYKSADAKGLLADLRFNNPYLKPRQILLIFGLKQALEVMPPRELRNFFGNHSSWPRIIKEAAKIELPIGYSSLRILKEKLDKFERTSI